MSDEQDHMDYEVNNHVEVSVTPFPWSGVPMSYIQPLGQI